jgi:hypothetical protein
VPDGDLPARLPDTSERATGLRATRTSISNNQQSGTDLNTIYRSPCLPCDSPGEAPVTKESGADPTLSVKDGPTFRPVTARDARRAARRAKELDGLWHWETADAADLTLSVKAERRAAGKDVPTLVQAAQRAASKAAGRAAQAERHINLSQRREFSLAYKQQLSSTLRKLGNVPLGDVDRLQMLRFAGQFAFDQAEYDRLAIERAKVSKAATEAAALRKAFAQAQHAEDYGAAAKIGPRKIAAQPQSDADLNTIGVLCATGPASPEAILAADEASASRAARTACGRLLFLAELERGARKLRDSFRAELVRGAQGLRIKRRALVRCAEAMTAATAAPVVNAAAVNMAAATPVRLGGAASNALSTGADSDDGGQNKELAEAEALSPGANSSADAYSPAGAAGVALYANSTAGAAGPAPAGAAVSNLPLEELPLKEPLLLGPVGDATAGVLLSTGADSDDGGQDEELAEAEALSPGANSSADAYSPAGAAGVALYANSTAGAAGPAPAGAAASNLPLEELPLKEPLLLGPVGDATGGVLVSLGEQPRFENPVLLDPVGAAAAPPPALPTPPLLGCGRGHTPDTPTLSTVFVV